MQLYIEGCLDFFKNFFDSTRSVDKRDIEIVGYFGIGVINLLLEITSLSFEGFSGLSSNRLTG